MGTLLGAATVFLLRDKMGTKFQKFLLGFASGVMIAASVWSLLIPAIEVSETQSQYAWLPPAIGFLGGMGFLLLLDTVIPHLHLGSDKPEGMKSKLGRSTMLMFAVTLHNIPEGMAVGVVLAGAISGQTAITIAGAITLSIGIAIQNFPEGAIISMPLKSNGMSRGRAFGYGVAQAREDLDDLVLDDRDGVARTVRSGSSRARHIVDRLAPDGRCLQAGFQLVDAGLRRLLQGVNLLSQLALLLGGNTLKLLHQGRQLALLAENLDTKLLNLGCCGGRESLDTLEKIFDFVDHCYFAFYIIFDKFAFV